MVTVKVPRPVPEVRSRDPVVSKLLLETDGQNRKTSKLWNVF